MKYIKSSGVRTPQRDMNWFLNPGRYFFNSPSWIMFGRDLGVKIMSILENSGELICPFKGICKHSEVGFTIEFSAFASIVFSS